MTQLPAVQAASTAAVTAQVSRLNEGLKAFYTTQFNNWLINWTAGRITDRNTAPAPPNGYVVGHFNDPTTGPGMSSPYGDLIVEWACPVVGDAPICEQPPIPDIPSATPPASPEPSPEVGNKVNAAQPAMDGFQEGYQLTRSDGSVWKKFRTVLPFGVVYYWQCISVRT